MANQEGLGVPAPPSRKDLCLNPNHGGLRDLRAWDLPSGAGLERVRPPDSHQKEPTLISSRASLSSFLRLIPSDPEVPGGGAGPARGWKSSPDLDQIDVPPSIRVPRGGFRAWDRKVLPSPLRDGTALIVPVIWTRGMINSCFLGGGRAEDEETARKEGKLERDTLPRGYVGRMAERFEGDVRPGKSPFVPSFHRSPQ